MLRLRLRLQYFGHLMGRAHSLEKTLMLTKIDDGHEFELTPGVGDGQGGLECCDSWGREESDTTERLN